MAYLLYLYPYSDCPKSLYISERMILLILCSGRDIVTIMDFFSMPRKAGQLSLVVERGRVYKRKRRLSVKLNLSNVYNWTGGIVTSLHLGSIPI